MLRGLVWRLYRIADPVCIVIGLVVLLRTAFFREQGGRRQCLCGRWRRLRRFNSIGSSVTVVKVKSTPNSRDPRLLTGLRPEQLKYVLGDGVVELAPAKSTSQQRSPLLLHSVTYEGEFEHFLPSHCQSNLRVVLEQLTHRFRHQEEPNTEYLKI
ncbi:hypothetical protein JZ751_000180 [Albula glossodonta]|uniref:Uncharacterized protein n=1 Tax=Albula glossodonta TaxID=121402 RepID=A0A8T2PV19_9TELE|nr:hypothetical protein JZ751_000180 [Albula glossodonta]